MKIVEKDAKKGKEELAAYEASKRVTENKIEILEEFRKSPAGDLVKEIFQEEIDSADATVRKILENDMKAVFLMEESKKKEHLELMSKKELVLTEIMGILKTVMGRIYPA